MSSLCRALRKTGAVFATLCFTLPTTLLAQNTDLSGVWSAEREYGRWIEGPVAVHQTDNAEWTAVVQGSAVPVAIDDAGNWHFKFPGQGEFIGWQSEKAGTIHGHWIQPPGVIAGYRHAQPVPLTRQRDGNYTGEIRPFRQRVSLNISLSAIEERSRTYRTFLRNPERNLGVYFRIEEATESDGSLLFADRDGNTLTTAELSDDRQSFRMFYPRFGETLVFTRRDRNTATAFYPRLTDKSVKALQSPVVVADGWQTAPPESVGFDESRLLAFVNEMVAFEPTGLRQPYLHSLLIARDGKLVFEEYFHGYHRDQTHDSRSAGKTIGSILLGIALRDGALPSIDEPVYPLYGGVDAFANPDPRKAEITLRHIVSMTAGFDCDDDNYDNPGNEDIMQEQRAEPDWYRYALSLPLVRAPGERGVYCTGGINLIGGAVEAVTGKTLLRLFEEEVARPLGIDQYFYNLMPTGQAYLGGGIRLRPRDFLKLGQAYLDGGEWGDYRLVSESWVNDSLAPATTLFQQDDYGFSWWRRVYTVAGRDIQTHYASGNGGQMLFVIPELNITMMINAGNYSDGRTRNHLRDRILQEFVLPAAL
ncbi:MAG: serine hydrolase [Pseudomonadota bacterium]